VTWDKSFPYGCAAFNFKAKRLPSAEVLQSSGHECLKFEAKSEVEHG